MDDDAPDNEFLKSNKVIYQDVDRMVVAVLVDLTGNDLAVLTWVVQVGQQKQHRGVAARESAEAS